jgi:DNA helicase-2/ATP-dependent DNA helicase PcrA
MTYLEQLNEGPLLVLAGAGSGKTRVITYRIAYLIDHVGVDPRQILAVTFTNKAADEMKTRVDKLLGDRELASSPTVSTFHSFCVRLLRRNIEHLGRGYTQSFSIYDDDDQIRVVKSCLRDLRVDEKMLPPRAVQSAISSAKSRGLDAQAYEDETKNTSDAKRSGTAQVFKLYEQRLLSANALDFDDLLIKAVQVLRSSSEVRDFYNDRLRFILVDEYQDTNRPQFELLRLLTDKSQNLCVVGDGDQAIYGWRGADIQNIVDFERHYHNASVITLDLNYRSTQTILSIANSLISFNRNRKEKVLRTENEQGEKVGYYHAFNGDDEARFVVENILDRIRLEPQTRIGVLYRTNAQSRLFEEACRRQGLSFNIVGGFSFYKRAEIRDIVAYLKFSQNLWDDESLRRIINSPPRGIGKKALEAVEAVARNHHAALWDSLKVIVAERTLPERSLEPLSQFVTIIERLVDTIRTGGLREAVQAAVYETGYAQALQEKSNSSVNALEAEGRLMNLEELVSAASEAEERGETVSEFIDHAALVSDADDYDPDAPVTLMTMHSAKGLEFPTVFVVGLEEGLFPHFRSHDDIAEMEEERRLFYVAITRAKKRLYISHARSRRILGKEAPANPSRFLRELPIEFLEDFSRGDSWLSSGLDQPSRRTSSSFERPTPKPKTTFQGKTYNSVESVREFLNQRGTSSPSPTTSNEPVAEAPSVKDGKRSFRPGMYVRHPMYGIGHILKREGAGDQVTLTINFPGYGQRKLMENAAPLEEP